MGEEAIGLTPRLSVTHLTLKTTMHDYELYGIQFFLNSCPHLEILKIQLGSGRIFYDVSSHYIFLL